MNTDEAIKRISIRLGIAGLSYEERQAWLVIRLHVERKVDDAMVERANVAYDACWANTESHDAAMKAALQASLGVEGA